MLDPKNIPVRKCSMASVEHLGIFSALNEQADSFTPSGFLGNQNDQNLTDFAANLTKSFHSNKLTPQLAASDHQTPPLLAAKNNMSMSSQQPSYMLPASASRMKAQSFHDEEIHSSSDLYYAPKPINLAREFFTPDTAAS